MKKAFIGTLLFLTITMSPAQAGGYGPNFVPRPGVSPADPMVTAGSVRMVSYVSFREADALPPELMLTFSLACNQTFLKLVRQDFTAGDIVHITVGGLIFEDHTNACLTANTAIEVDAGPTFSGRQSMVEPIIF